MKCIDCENERDVIRIDRGKERLRTRCRICWNKYSRKCQLNHKDYYSKYIGRWTKEKIKSDNKKKRIVYAVNNKSNKKAIKQLSDSYIKNSIMKGRAWDESMRCFIEIKRAIMQINRLKKTIKNDNIK